MTFSWFSYIPANFQMPYLTWCEILNFPLNFFTLNISLCMWPLNSFMSVCLILFQALIIKVRTFWEAHKDLRNLPHALYIYSVNDQTMRKIFFKLCVLLRKSELLNSKMVFKKESLQDKTYGQFGLGWLCSFWPH